MRTYIILIFITSLAVQGCQMSCEESRQLESTCGSYCFKTVRPLLDYNKLLNGKLDNLEDRREMNTIMRLDNIEILLYKKFEKLEEQLKEVKMLPKRTSKPEMNLHYQKIGMKFYYIEQKTQLNWFNAAHKCHEMGGHLASLQNSQELEVLSTKLTHMLYWLDINDLGQEGEYYSLTTGLKAPFLKWYTPGEPNNVNKSEHCVQLRSVNNVYSMNDDSCTDLSYFICEKEFPNNF